MSPKFLTFVLLAAYVLASCEIALKQIKFFRFYVNVTKSLYATYVYEAYKCLSKKKYIRMDMMLVSPSPWSATSHQIKTPKPAATAAAATTDTTITTVLTIFDFSTQKCCPSLNHTNNATN